MESSSAARNYILNEIRYISRYIPLPIKKYFNGCDCDDKKTVTYLLTISFEIKLRKGTPELFIPINCERNYSHDRAILTRSLTLSEKFLFQQ